MKKILSVTLFLFCLSISPFHFAFAAEGSKTAAQSQAKAVEEAKLAAQSQAADIDNLKTRIAVLKETSDLQREVDALKSQVAALDTYVGRVIDIVAITATLFGIVFGLLGFLVRQDAKEAIGEAKDAVKETVKIRDEAKKLLENIEALHGKAEQEAKDMADLNKKMKESGENPSAEITNGLKLEFDKLSNDLADTLSKATSEKEKISEFLENELLAEKEAAQFLKKQDKQLPASHYFNLGIEAYGNGRNNEAIQHYSAAIRLKPDYASAYNNRGNAKGNYEEAIADYDKAIQLKPDHAFAYNNRGNVKRNLGRYEEAIADYDSVIQLKPDDADAYQNKAEALICLSKCGDAETTLAENAARFITNGDKAVALYLLRLALVAQGKDDGKAITDYETLLKNALGLSIKGWNYKPIDEKLAEIERTKELPPDRIEKMKAIHAEFKKLAK